LTGVLTYVRINQVKKLLIRYLYISDYKVRGFGMEKKNYFEKKEMTLSELNEYYRALRKELYDANESLKYIELRKKIYFLVRKIIEIELKINHISVNVLNDESVKNNKPRIYAVTHVARYDIESILLAINESAYFVWGDPGELYRRPEMILLNMIGMIFVDTDNKQDRHISLETMVKLLKQNGNIIIFPEGAWNITDNEVVMKLFPGVIEAAIRGNADIIPVAVDKDEKDNYYVKIGQNISMLGKKISDKYDEADTLRGILAGLKWDIWEYIGYLNRSNQSSRLSRSEFIYSIMKDSDNDYTIDAINKSRYIDKNIVTLEEAFSHLADIHVDKNNAFLFKNMNTFERELQAKTLKKKL